MLVYHGKRRTNPARKYPWDNIWARFFDDRRAKCLIFNADFGDLTTRVGCAIFIIIQVQDNEDPFETTREGSLEYLLPTMY